MTNKYYVLFYPGAGGMFLTAVLSKCLGLATDVKISPQGHCHDMGDGIYVNTNQINMAGWHWNVSGKYAIINGHCSDLNKIRQDLPEHKIVYISVEDDDVFRMTNLRFYKTMSPMSYREYDKFVEKFEVSDWPSYSTLIATPEMVKDSITSYDAIWYQEWKRALDTTQVDFVIPFKVLYGLNSTSLADIISSVFGLHVDDDTKAFIKDYQFRNSNLYKEYE